MSPLLCFATGLLGLLSALPVQDAAAGAGPADEPAVAAPGDESASAQTDAQTDNPGVEQDAASADDQPGEKPGDGTGEHQHPDVFEDTWLDEFVPDAWRGHLDHPWVVALVVIVLSVLLARLVDLFVSLLVRRVARRTVTSVDDELLDQLHGPVVKTVVLIGLWVACRVLESEQAPALWAHRLIMTLVVAIWSIGVLRMVVLVLRQMAGQRSRFQIVDERTLPLFDNMAKLVVLALSLYAVIQVWNLDATGWLASAGVAGIALGFAAKDTLANLFSGIFIIADAPYRVGDYVNLDSGHRGRVQHIGLRSTRILTRDDIEITVPNSIIGNGAIVNESSGPPRYRLHVPVGVAYGSDIDRVRATLLALAAAEDKLLKVPEPRVRFRRFGDSALEIELLCWIRDPEQRGLVMDALNTSVYRDFAEAGIEIAFPQRDLHLRSVPEGFGRGAG